MIDNLIDYWAPVWNKNYWHLLKKPEILPLWPFAFSYFFLSSIGVGIYFVIGKARNFPSIFTKSQKLRSENLTLGQSTTKVNCPGFQNVRLLHLKCIWLLILAKNFFLQHIFHWSNFSVVFFSQNVLSTQNKFISKDYLFMPIT